MCTTSDHILSRHWLEKKTVLSFRLYRITVIFQVVKIEGYTIVKITNEKVQLIPEGGNWKVSIQKFYISSYIMITAHIICGIIRLNCCCYNIYSG